MACSTGIPYEGWGPHFPPRCIRDWRRGAADSREVGSRDRALWLPVSFVGPTNHREMKSIACKRGRESRGSSNHEVFWVSRLMPPHLTSLSLNTETVLL